VTDVDEGKKATERMSNSQRALCLAASAWAMTLGGGHAEEAWGFESAGLRTGFSATGIDQHFRQLDAFTRFDSPWSAKISQEYRFNTTMDLSAGTLAHEGNFGFIGSFGPVFTFSKQRFPIEVAIGISPTILSRLRYRSVDFGMPFQFTSHGGFNFLLSDKWVANYRFQHMSNAGLSRHNTGLSLHSLSVAYRF
jgi:hypothetical protein